MKSHLAMLLTILAASFVLVGSSPSAQAQKLAGPNRPAAVPQGYVITPFGYFHPYCVREVASGGTVLADGRVQHADGTVDAEAPVCNYPRYTARGEIVTVGIKPPTISYSWIEDGEAVNTTSSFGELTANWTVPPAPTTKDGQVVYLFPWMEDYGNTETIIQPVLGWGAAPDEEPYWTIASWNCCPSGTANYSTPLQVNPGDTLYGTIESTCSSGTISCPKWDITTEDRTIRQSTTLWDTPSEGQTFNWAGGGALEVYEIAECSDYPPNQSITFSNLELYDYNFKKYPRPGWVFFIDLAPGSTPQCNYGGTTTEMTVTLDY
jgi:hypothetical protein